MNVSHSDALVFFGATGEAEVIPLHSNLERKCSIIGYLRCAMALKTRKKRIEAPATSPRRKAKFQADLAPAEDLSVRLLKEELQLSSNTDFLSDAVALFRWAVSERKLGQRIMSASEPPHACSDSCAEGLNGHCHSPPRRTR